MHSPTQVSRDEIRQGSAEEEESHQEEEEDDEEDDGGKGTDIRAVLLIACTWRVKGKRGGGKAPLPPCGEMKKRQRQNRRETMPETFSFAASLRAFA